jgi:hypothetical protein
MKNSERNLTYLTCERLVRNRASEENEEPNSNEERAEKSKIL